LTFLLFFAEILPNSSKIPIGFKERKSQTEEW